ncbi:hypothetical protein PVAND_005626 [Polypedilum vanderplanki]|uniref:Zinc-hook domain-containing protein n=1 Tax=Polypedilum vanderplanki TaxID=319348 RepID=A0A9J6C0R1_POLVA|nr:hypothetical protein PVAND_005626 [Polypedilum vanderplanki]
MSLLNKLHIQGIRSFGLDKEDEQRIEFTSPVTLIVGENGCGKTTIIECLKYALTGDVPPGSDRGKNFIHESNLHANRTIFMGKVKLTVTDSQQVDKTVVRAMKLDNSKAKPKFETLNSSITFQHKNGQREDVSGRVDDINNYMCETMGVSKSILNNVIFCHQEDSNWPLDEGKKLKEKFDAIFGTTEYNKAIDRIIKIRKEYQKQLAEIKGDIKYNAEIKSQVDKKERKIKELQAELNGVDDKFKKLEDALIPLQEENLKILEKERNYSKHLSEQQNCRNIFNNKKDEYVKLQERITKNGGKIDRDLESLKQQQLNFEKDRQDREKNKESLEEECKKLKSLKEKKRNDMMTLNGKMHEYTSDYQRLQDIFAERFDKMQEICSKLNIPFTDDMDQSINTQSLADTLSNIKQYILSAEENFVRLKAEAKKDEDAYQLNIDKIREERTKLETNIATQRNLIQEKTEIIAKLKREIASTESLIPKLKEIQPQIEATEKKLKRLNDENNTEDMTLQQSLLQTEILELEDDQVKIDKSIEVLHSASQFTNELESKQKELTENQKEYTRLKNKSASNFKALFSNKDIENNFHHQMQAKQTELKKGINDVETKIKEKQHEKDRIIMERNNLRKTEEKLEDEIRTIERKIRDLCGDQDYMSVLEAQKDKVAKQNMELALLESSKTTYNSYIEKINDVPCCPLCSKDFEIQEADDLITELKESISKLPEKIARVRKVLHTETRKFDQLNEIRPSYEKLKELKNDKINAEEKLVKFGQDLLKNDECIDDLEYSLTEPKALCDMITTSVLTEMMKLDTLQRSINNKTKEIDTIKSNMPKNIPNMKLSEAMAKRKELSEKIKNKNETERKLEKEVKEYNNMLMDARDELNNLQAQKNEYQTKMQGIEKSKEEIKRYVKENKDLEQQLAVSEQQIEPLKKKLDTLIQKKKACHDENEEKLQQQQITINQLKVDDTKIDNLNKQIRALESKNLEERIDQTSKDIKTIQQEINMADKNFEEKENEIQEIRDFLNKGEITLFNIQDNIIILKVEEELKAAKEKYSILKKTIGDLDHENMVKEKNQNSEEIAKISSSRQKLFATKELLYKTIEEHERDLKKDPKFKDAKAKYQKSIVQECVLQRTIDDLNKYRAVLEKALLQFHQEKMDQINHTVKQLWNDIYKGNDIDFIMIKTDEEGATSSDKKRSYNYRVVQQKLGGEWSEMRGRCSAGQKVLASLIIRIALADTFSAKCGILALDEPTTNLDQVNIKSLSNALAQLVSQRNDGRFMLIVITHDESFIASLDQTDMYYRVSRNHKGLSVIEEVRY